MVTKSISQANYFIFLVSNLKFIRIFALDMMHCFAMKMYSKRRKRKLEIVQEDLKNEISL